MTKMYHTNVPRSFAAVQERYNTLDFPCRKIVCQGALPLWDPSHARHSRRANVQTSRVVFAHFKGGPASSEHHRQGNAVPLYLQPTGMHSPLLDDPESKGQFPLKCLCFCPPTHMQISLCLTFHNLQKQER